MAHSIVFAISTWVVFITAMTFIQSNLVIATTHDNLVGDNDYRMIMGVKVYRSDRECAMVGGYCVHETDCISPTSNKGLCPSNSHAGVECCFEFRVGPAPCVEHFGACMERCNPLLMRPGNDCKKGTVCCVLVT